MQAFRRWLEQQGWTTEIEVDHADIAARRGEEILFAEVKGDTKTRPGAGVDSMYGQLPYGGWRLRKQRNVEGAMPSWYRRGRSAPPCEFEDMHETFWASPCIQ